MNRRNWAIVSGCSLFISLFLFMVAGSVLDSRPLVDDKDRRCEGGPTVTESRITERSTPRSRAVDSATGVVYLRYDRQIITITPKQNNKCTVQTEDLSRYNTGFYTHLGPGFSPSAPSNSSGGSSGSSGGVK